MYTNSVLFLVLGGIATIAAFVSYFLTRNQSRTRQTVNSEGVSLAVIWPNGEIVKLGTLDASVSQAQAKECADASLRCIEEILVSQRSDSSES